MGRIKPRYLLKCIKCEAIKPHDENLYCCSVCGGLFMPERDEAFIKQQIGFGTESQMYFDSIRYGRLAQRYPYGSGVFMWLKYILPGFPEKAVLSLKEGLTDLFEPPRWLKRQIGLNRLYIKMEGQSPSESFKDRGMPVAVSEARRLQLECPELGISAVACASTGDTSASAAAYAAYYRDVLRSIVFLPFEKISPGQLAQAMMYGALVVAIKHRDGFDGCMRLIKEFCAKNPSMVLVNSANAFRLIGQETIALEIFQDLRWKAPRWISIPVGNGGNLTALLLSCLRARDHGLIDRLPGIIVAQAKNTNTLVRWARSGFTKYEPGKFHDTIASAMNIQDPVSFPRIKRLYDCFEILYYDVDDRQIQETRARFNRAGADICPQGSVAVSAVLQARDDRRSLQNEVVVAVSTASGLKFIDSAIDHHLNGSRKRFANPYRVVENASLEKIEQAVKSAL